MRDKRCASIDFSMNAKKLGHNHDIIYKYALAAAGQLLIALYVCAKQTHTTHTHTHHAPHTAD